MMRAAALAAALHATVGAPVAAFELAADTDSAFAEAYESCLAAIHAGGALDESLGWTSHDTGDAAALVSDHWSKGFATKEVEGVGGFNLSVTIEQYPGYELGLCSVAVDQPAREIDPPKLKKIGIPGTLQGDGADWWGLWRDADGRLFVRASLSSDPGAFRLSMTRIEERPQ